MTDKTQPIRTQEEIETELHQLLMRGVRESDAAWSIVFRIFDEVKEYGAEEQRWLDTEGAEPKHVTPLYTHPTNVSALEERIKNLVGSLREIVQMAEGDCSYDTGPYLRIARAALSCDGEHS